MKFDTIINNLLKEEMPSRDARAKAMKNLVPFSSSSEEPEKSHFERPLTDEELKTISKLSYDEMEVEVEYKGVTYSVVVNDEYPYSVMSIVGNLGDGEIGEDYIVQITQDNLPIAFSIIGNLAQEQAEEELGSYPREVEQDWDDIGD